MTIEITPTMLAHLCAPCFSYEAAAAIYDYMEEAGCGNATIGDICISFSEVPMEQVNDYDEECVVAELTNGNVVVLN